MPQAPRGLGRVLTERTTQTIDGQPVSKLTTHVYDADGQLLRTIYPDGSVTSRTYDANGNVLTETDALNRVTAHSYDAQNRKTSTRYPGQGIAESWTYDAEGRELSYRDSLGRTTKKVYDKLGRLIETIHPDSTPGIDTDNPRTKSVYDAAGRMTQSIDALGRTTTYEYDAAGRQTAVIDALNQRTETTYDAAGQRTSSTDALGRTTKYVYDLAGRLTETIHPDSTPATDADNPRTRVQYDAAGRKVAETDAEGRTVAYGHDATGRLTQVTDALGKITRYGYDEAGNQISQTDARGRVTRWGYDRMGRQVSRTLPMGQQEQMSYNAGGELVSHTDFMGRTTLHEYDNRGRRIKTTHGDGRITQASYDDAGRRTSLSEGSNSWSWQYDARDRVTQLTQPAGVVSYQYDLAGNRTRTTSANQVVSYQFDALNRLRTVRTGTPANPPTASTPAHEYEYAANGLRTAEVRPNGTRTEYAYNVRNHVTSVLHKAAAGALLLGLSYGVDATGLRDSITETVDGGALSRVTAYEYDANKRLIREEITRAGQTGTQVTSWVYDDVGNRVSQTVDGATLNYTYDANDRLLTESDGTSHVYDNNGNLVRTEKGSATQRYSWDSSGRLSEHTDASGVRTAYSYDPDRIRVSRTSRLGEADAQRTAYLIDYLQPYAQVLEEASGSASSSVLAHQVAYVHGDDLIAQVRGGVAQHYHYDALGSTRLLSGASGAVSDRYAYTAYGELDTSGSLIASENAYRYTGEQFDSGLGMYYLRARYMDPGRGRFVGMDPFAGVDEIPSTKHRYRYGGNSPNNIKDPSGLVDHNLTTTSVTANQTTNLGLVSAVTLQAQAAATRVGLIATGTPVLANWGNRFPQLAAQAGQRGFAALHSHVNSVVRLGGTTLSNITSSHNLGSGYTSELARIFGSRASANGMQVHKLVEASFNAPGNITYSVANMAPTWTRVHQQITGVHARHFDSTGVSLREYIRGLITANKIDWHRLHFAEARIWVLGNRLNGAPIPSQVAKSIIDQEIK